MKTYFNIKTFLAIVAIVVAACSGQSEQQTSSNNNQEEITPTKRPPVFSLFNNKERDRYQIYRNTDKLTLIAPVAVHAVRVNHKIELYSFLLQGVDELQRVLEMHIVVSGAVGKL